MKLHYIYYKKVYNSTYNTKEWGREYEEFKNKINSIYSLNI